MTKLELLKCLEFGARVAEDEVDTLERYFLETEQWKNIRGGQIDVVYGPKGSGKSALYTLLNRKEDDLFDDGILLAAGENVSGSTVFSAIVSEPPPSEASFQHLWKLYCLVLAAKTLREYDVENEDSITLIEALQNASLLPHSKTLSGFFKAATRYIHNWLKKDAKTVEVALTFDPETGLPSVSRKSEFAEHNEQQLLDEIPVDDLLATASSALKQAELQLWITFDRLDVAFARSPELERNALRALFRAYNDIKSHPNISLKIFVRDDIWRRITVGGFTEASHITKQVHITWSPDELLNLIVLRLLNNDELVRQYSLQTEDIKADAGQQSDFFHTVVPDQVDTGKNPSTLNWIVSRCADGSQKTAPREVIHLLEQAKSIQIRRLERGVSEPEGALLIDRSSFKEALGIVSKVRFEQTLLAEYPEFKEYLEQLEGEKCEHTIGTLSKLWGISKEDCNSLAKKLTEIGFFEQRGPKESPTFWVPFLYRSALSLVQGRAD